MTSLSSLKKPGILYAELCFKRNGGFGGSFLIVEGDDDSRFWRRKIMDKYCNLVIAGCRPSVEGVVRKVDEQRLAGALGLVDADFSGIEGSSPSANLLYTEHHDLETFLLQHSALDAVLAAYGEATLISAFTSHTGQDVRTALLERGLPFGRLRWASQRNSLGIRFTRLSHMNFIAINGWRLDVDALYAAAANDCGLSVDDLKAHVDALPDAPPWSICQGHDLLYILNIGLANALGRKSPGHNHIGAVLFQTLLDHEFHTSSIYRDIRAWESRNPPYLILAHPSQPSP